MDNKVYSLFGGDFTAQEFSTLMNGIAESAHMRTNPISVVDTITDNISDADMALIAKTPALSGPLRHALVTTLQHHEDRPVKVSMDDGLLNLGRAVAAQHMLEQLGKSHDTKLGVVTPEPEISEDSPAILRIDKPHNGAGSGSWRAHTGGPATRGPHSLRIRRKDDDGTPPL